MSGEGIIAGTLASYGAGDLDDAYAAGAGAQRVRDAAFLDAYAARIVAGPRQRESWEPPANTDQHDPAFARETAALITGLAQSIRTGLTAADNPSGDDA